MIVRQAAVALDLIRVHGAPKFFVRILPWMIRRRYILYSGSFDTPLPDFRADIPLKIGPARPADLALIARIRPGFFNLDRVRERFDQGHVCFLAWAGDRPVHARWAFGGSVFLPYLSKRLVLGARDIFYDETYTVPSFRHRGVDYQTLRVLLAWFKEKGYARHHCLLTSWDISLHRRASAFCMKRTGEVGGWSVLGFKGLTCRGLIRDEGRGLMSIVPPED